VKYLFVIYFISFGYHYKSYGTYGKSGLALIIFCLFLLLPLTYFRNKHVRRQKEQEIQFKNTTRTEGIKITVSSDRCKVISKTYTVPNPYLRKIRFRRPTVLDYIYDNVNYNEYIEIKECYIECGAKVNNSRKVFKSNAIKMDTKTLEIKVYMKKEIDIYYNPHTKKYFFDLDFLDE
jgi:hypothetical protein